jgi:hypothetical protein
MVFFTSIINERSVEPVINDRFMFDVKPVTVLTEIILCAVDDVVRG